MPIRIVINGREITSPVAKFALGVLAAVIVFPFALFLLFVVLPLLGLTFALISSIILAAFITALLIALLFSLPVFRPSADQKRLEDDNQSEHHL